MNAGMQGRTGWAPLCPDPMGALVLSWLFAWAGYSHAAEPPFSWEPFGFALGYDMEEVDMGVWPALNTLTPTEAQVWQAARRTHSWIDEKFCPSTGSFAGRDWEPLCAGDLR